MANINRSLRFVTVSRKPGNPSQGLLKAGHLVFPCALGRSGTSARKREGDGATPIAAMRVLSARYRAEVPGARHWRLPAGAISATDGWCDAPRHACYNRPVRLPFKPSHERMRRDDHLYDRLVVIDWNIVSRQRGRGSAIFMHLAKPGYQPTEGCIAVSRRTMDWLLPRLSRQTIVRVLG